MHDISFDVSPITRLDLSIGDRSEGIRNVVSLGGILDQVGGNGSSRMGELDNN